MFVLLPNKGGNFQFVCFGIFDCLTINRISSKKWSYQTQYTPVTFCNNKKSKNKSKKIHSTLFNFRYLLCKGSSSSRRHNGDNLAHRDTSLTSTISRRYPSRRLGNQSTFRRYTIIIIIV